MIKYEIREVEISEIEPDVETHINLQSATSAAIETLGFFTAVILKRPAEGKLIVVDGKKRITDAKAAHISRIPAIILLESDTFEEDCAFVYLCISNLKGINILEDVNAVKCLIDKGYDEKQIAKKTGIKKAVISKLNKAYYVPVDLKIAIQNGHIQQKMIHSIASLPDEAKEEALMVFNQKKELTSDEIKTIKEKYMVEKEVKEEEPEDTHDIIEGLKNRIKEALQNGLNKDDIVGLIEAAETEEIEI